MSKREPGKDIVKIPAPVGTPDYLAKYVETDQSLDSMQKYRVVPRLKVVQATAGEDLQSKFDVGSVILAPGGALVAGMNEDKKERHSVPFQFVPVMFFTEFLKVRDIKDKEGSMIMERSFDETSQTAKHARDVKLREEIYDEAHKFKARYSEVLCFPGIIYNVEHPLKGEVATLNFSRGEFSAGTSFISSLTIRRTPLWSQVYSLFTSFRAKSADRKWWGIDAKCAENPNILESEVEFFKTTYDELRKAFDAKRLIVDRSDNEEDAVEVNTVEEKSF